MSASWILPYFFFICLFQNSKLLSIKVAHFVFQIFGSAQGTSSLQLCTKFERLLFITSVKRTATQVVYFLFDCPHFWCCSGSILQTLWLLCLLEGEFANFIGVSDAHKHDIICTENGDVNDHNTQKLLTFKSFWESESVNVLIMLVKYEWALFPSLWTSISVDWSDQF